MADLRIEFLFDADGMIERVRETGDGMTSTELIDPDDIRRAKIRVLESPVAGDDRSD